MNPDLADSGIYSFCCTAPGNANLESPELKDVMSQSTRSCQAVWTLGAHLAFAVIKNKRDPLPSTSTSPRETLRYSCSYHLMSVFVTTFPDSTNTPLMC